MCAVPQSISMHVWKWDFKLFLCLFSLYFEEKMATNSADKQLTLLWPTALCFLRHTLASSVAPYKPWKIWCNWDLHFFQLTWYFFFFATNKYTNSNFYGLASMCAKFQRLGHTLFLYFDLFTVPRWNFTSTVMDLTFIRTEPQLGFGCFNR